ncbi:MAG: hypothetical protein ABIN57_03165 [Chitinophagaceae bacterium]
MKTKLLFILPFILLSVASSAQHNSFSVVAGKEKIVIGEPFNVLVQTTFGKGTLAKWITIDTIPHFEILSKSKIDTQAVGNNITLKQNLTVTSWDSGRWQLQVFSSSQLTSRAKPLMVSVSFSPFDVTQDYHDVKDILDVKKPERITWYWYLIGAALLLVLLALLFPKSKKGKEIVVSPEDAYKEAMVKLNALENKKEEDPKLFYTSLIDIFRTYVMQSKGIHSFQKTTDDLSIQMKNLQLPSEDYNALVQVLRLSDVVKFARFTPADSEKVASVAQIKKSILLIQNIK